MKKVYLVLSNIFKALYSYAFIVYLIVLFACVGNLPQWYISFMFVLFFCAAIPFAFAVIDSIIFSKGKYDSVIQAKSNMIVRLVQIPAYIAGVILSIIGLSYSVWGLPIIIIVLLVDIISVFSNGIASIGSYLNMYRNKKCDLVNTIMYSFFSFVFIVDIVFSILTYLKIRQNKTLN